MKKDLFLRSASATLRTVPLDKKHHINRLEIKNAQRFVPKRVLFFL